MPLNIQFERMAIEREGLKLGLTNQNCLFNKIMRERERELRFLPSSGLHLSFSPLLGPHSHIAYLSQNPPPDSNPD